MKALTLLYPHQLFWPNPALHKNQSVVLVEDPLFFTQYHFHQQKIVFHRATLKAYQQRLEKSGYSVYYIETAGADQTLFIHLSKLSKKGLQELHYIDPVDDWLHKKIKKLAITISLTLRMQDNPGFLNNNRDVADFFNQRKTYFQTDFYCWQRKQRKILVDKNGKPTGGQWTFDAANRKRYPDNVPPPELPKQKASALLKEALQYTQQHFPKNPGDINHFLYPVTHEDAQQWFKDFLKNRFHDFGDYEDAISTQHAWLHHSLLSPLLNVGLLTPQQVIEQSLAYATQHKIPLNSLEGFVRQIMGWREFIKIVYEREGAIQRTKNYWKFTRKIPSTFWTANTGIEPIDHLIKQLQQHAYTHHIERLMVLGNFMLLCEFDPNEVYRWFMEWYIDSYDWVMVPNVYGMTQFADGGLMTTKPYISGSNYILKMSTWKKGKTQLLEGVGQVCWTEIWDGLFWRFMDKQRQFFSKNPRLGMLLKTLDKMDPAKKERHFLIATAFLTKIDRTK